MQCACAILSSVDCPALRHFSTLSKKRQDFFWGGGIQHKMCVLIFSAAFESSISSSKKNSARYDQECISVFTQSSRYSCQILMELEFSRQIFERHSNIKFHENPSSGSPAATFGRTDRYTERQADMTKLTVAFRNFPKAPKNGKLKREE